jgi:hypothetical protein
MAATIEDHDYPKRAAHKLGVSEDVALALESHVDQYGDMKVLNLLKGSRVRCFPSYCPSTLCSHIFFSVHLFPIAALVVSDLKSTAFFLSLASSVSIDLSLNLSSPFGIHLDAFENKLFLLLIGFAISMQDLKNDG